jgi:hypothetical protein
MSAPENETFGDSQAVRDRLKHLMRIFSKAGYTSFYLHDGQLKTITDVGFGPNYVELEDLQKFAVSRGYTKAQATRAFNFLGRITIRPENREWGEDLFTKEGNERYLSREELSRHTAKDLMDRGVTPRSAVLLDEFARKMPTSQD